MTNTKARENKFLVGDRVRVVDDVMDGSHSYRNEDGDRVSFSYIYLTGTVKSIVVGALREYTLTFDEEVPSELADYFFFDNELEAINA